MRRRPPRTTRTYTLFPYTTRFRSPEPSISAAYRDQQSSPSQADQIGLSIRRPSGDQPVLAPRFAMHAHPRSLCFRSPFAAATQRKNLRGISRATSSSRSEEHTSELQSLMRISYAVFCLKKKNKKHT